MYKSFIEPLEYFATTALDGIADLLGNGGGKLRDAPSDGTVMLPQALYAQADVQTEWWYYTGHCTTETSREFGFELVFFKRRTDLDKIGIVPMTALANPMYFAHFAISDVTAGVFKYDHIRSFNKPFDTPVSMSETACDVRLGEWSLREIAGKHVLHATLSDGTVFDAVLESQKPIVLNGENGSGITLKKSGASNHFSYTRMKVDGQVTRNGDLDRFKGTAWMDREYGIWEQGEWDWFSIQFDDDTELMIYQFDDAEGHVKGDSTGTYVMPDGTCEYLKRSDFEIEATDTWKSPRTGAEYPSGWIVKVARLGLEIDITPFIKDQELDTRGSTMIVYWEGACSVNGKKAGTPVKGQAYVELVGYDRSHEKIGITDFLFGKTLDQLKESLPI
ncbi:MAG: lipocalin family protein [Pyrinomonadaceae bacterium]